MNINSEILGASICSVKIRRSLLMTFDNQFATILKSDVTEKTFWQFFQSLFYTFGGKSFEDKWWRLCQVVLKNKMGLFTRATKTNPALIFWRISTRFFPVFFVSEFSDQPVTQRDPVTEESDQSDWQSTRSDHSSDHPRAAHTQPIWRLKRRTM